MNLVDTKVTSAGLPHCHGWQQLPALYVRDIKLNPVAVDQLKSKLPKWTITDFTPG